MNGKGDKLRPCLVPHKVYEDNYEQTFRKKDEKDDQESIEDNPESPTSDEDIPSSLA